MKLKTQLQIAYETRSLLIFNIYFRHNTGEGERRNSTNK
jgi:hypothetical protein